MTSDATEKTVVDNANKVWEELSDNLGTFIKSAETLVDSLKKAIEESNLESSTIEDTQVTKCSKLLQEESLYYSAQSQAFEPTRVSIECSAKASETLGESKRSIQDSKHSRSKLKKKQSGTPFAKEKNEKLVKLKESLATAQTNLKNIQEEVRQLERLYEDYDSHNTPEGQMNPAALYKEIMKPQSVPFVPCRSSACPNKNSRFT